jgi:hypothetical protein
MMQKMTAWQAALLYHIRKGSVFGKRPTLHVGYVEIRHERMSINGEVQIGRARITLDENGIILKVPKTLAVRLRGKPMSDIVAIPETGNAKIDEGVKNTFITAARTGDKGIHFDLQSPLLLADDVFEATRS